jgi:hypothetical protein
MALPAPARRLLGRAGRPSLPLASPPPQRRRSAASPRAPPTLAARPLPAIRWVSARKRCSSAGSMICGSPCSTISSSCGRHRGRRGRLGRGAWGRQQARAPRQAPAQSSRRGRRRSQGGRRGRRRGGAAAARTMPYSCVLLEASTSDVSRSLLTSLRMTASICGAVRGRMGARGARRPGPAALDGAAATHRAQHLKQQRRVGVHGGGGDECYLVHGPHDELRHGVHAGGGRRGRHPPPYSAAPGRRVGGTAPTERPLYRSTGASSPGGEERSTSAQNARSSGSR